MKPSRGTFLFSVLAASIALGLFSGPALGGSSSSSQAGVVHAPKPTHTPRNQGQPGLVQSDVGLVKMKQDKRTPSYIARPTPNQPGSNRPTAKATVTPPRNRPHP